MIGERETAEYLFFVLSLGMGTAGVIVLGLSALRRAFNWGERLSDHLRLWRARRLHWREIARQHSSRRRAF